MTCSIATFPSGVTDEDVGIFGGHYSASHGSLEVALSSLLTDVSLAGCACPPSLDPARGSASAGEAGTEAFPLGSDASRSGPASVTQRQGEQTLGQAISRLCYV